MGAVTDRTDGTRRTAEAHAIHGSQIAGSAGATRQIGRIRRIRRIRPIRLIIPQRAPCAPRPQPPWHRGPVLAPASCLRAFVPRMQVTHGDPLHLQPLPVHFEGRQ